MHPLRMQLVMLQFSDRVSWIAIRHPDRHRSQIAIHCHKTNDIVDCKFLSDVNTFRPGLHWRHWLNKNAMPCALATFTHPFSRPLTIKDVHVSPLPAHLHHPDWNISSIIVCLSDGSVHTDYWHQSAAHSSPSILKFIRCPFGSA